jgi:hypothetical protein
MNTDTTEHQIETSKGIIRDEWKHIQELEHQAMVKLYLTSPSEEEKLDCNEVVCNLYKRLVSNKMQHTYFTYGYQFYRIRLAKRTFDTKDVPSLSDVEKFCLFKHDIEWGIVEMKCRGDGGWHSTEESLVKTLDKSQPRIDINSIIC